jgi:tRNA 2-thiouridine synthesizing protein A
METLKIDQQLNLKGEVCPYTFVKSKLALEDMESGEVLQVVVDHLPAVTNVPRSLTNEGHAVLDVSQISDRDWTITVRKA